MKMCSIASGSSGNCIYVGSERYVLSCGCRASAVSGCDQPDCRILRARYVGALDGIFVTHEHSVTIFKGLGVLARKYRQYRSMQQRARSDEIVRPSQSEKCTEGIFHPIQADQDTVIGDMTIHPFRDFT